MAALPDSRMQSLLQNARKCSSSQSQEYTGGVNGLPDPSVVRNIPIQVPHSHRGKSSTRMSAHSPKRSAFLPENEAVNNRRLSEAGVNRRPSAAHILTEDTDSFIIGDRVYVDGIKPGRIQYIGVTKFGHGDDWAGVFLDEPFGKNDGSVGSERYFTCEPKHGVFSKLHRLTREPMEGAKEALDQMRRYGYEVLDSNTSRRRSSVGSGGGRRDSMSLDDEHSGRKSVSPYNRASITPEPPQRRDSSGCHSPESHSSGGNVGASGRRASGTRHIPIAVKDSLSTPNHGSYGSSPGNRRSMPPPGRSPLASPRNSRSNLGIAVKIDKDPELVKLTSEARRLSVGGSAKKTNELADGRKSPMPTRSGQGQIPDIHQGPFVRRRTSETLGLPKAGSRSRSGSESESFSGGGRRPSGSHCELHRKPSNELSMDELQQRRLSEAGLRKTSDVVLNANTSGLMVGLPVWVDGKHKGRIAFIGEVHFAKGEMAGIHLDQPIGKNNGTVGGAMYFQCEPRRGIFSRLHRLTTEPQDT